MAAYFLDSSALVKRYVREIGTVWLTNLTSPISSNEIFIARITGAEMVAAIARAKRVGGISSTDALRAQHQFRQEFARNFQIVEIVPAVVARAMDMAWLHSLRGYDSVQLSVACILNQRRLASGLSAITVISADHALNAASSSEGLLVDNPNNHP